MQEIQSKSRRVYITYRRILEIGSTEGCRGCEGDSSNHSSECVARFEEAFGRSSKPSDEVEPVLEEIEGVAVDEGEYTPSIAPSNGTDVPECPPPRDIELEIFEGPHSNDQGVGAVASIASDFTNVLPDNEIQDVFGLVLSKAEQVGCLGATAKPSKVT